MLITGTLPASTTLRAIAPFVLEGTCLLIIFTLAILLAIPFVSSHINILFKNYKKFKKNLNGIEILEAPSTTNCPSLSPLPSATKLPSSYPTPVNRSIEESVVNKDETCDSVLPEVCENFGSNFCQISYDPGFLVSYNSYRHKLIEETLQKQYGGDYAPGNVILNLIQLNTADSGASVILSKKYDNNFFENVKIADTVQAIDLIESNDSRFKDVGFPDPLTHFIPRNSRKPSTAEIHTETTSPSEISIAQKSSAISSARPNTPTSCQRIIPKRSREANYPVKSPFVTPAHSQAPLRSQRSESNSPCRGEAVNLIPNVRLRDQAPLTEQLYRRNDTRPDVVSRTHVEAEEYLNRIAKNKRYEINTTMQEPRIRSSLKKSKHQTYEGKKLFSDDHKVANIRNGDSVKIRRSVKDDVRHNLSSSKPTIWNN